MKKHLLRICSVLLTITIIISSLPLSAVSLTAKQQEDFYRVNTWWQDAENKEFIDWLLESDNFLYHLDITEGDIIHDMSYAGLNLNAKERKDNFVEILTSFIGLSYDEIREASVGEALSNMSMEFLNGFEDYLEATELYTVEQFEYMSKAIKETSDYYLNHYYGINTDMDQYGYETIYQRIQSAFDNRVQNFDFPDRKAETMDAFFDFVASSEWLNKLSSISNVFSLVGDGLNIAQEGFALLGEVESYEKTDERLIELLKYIRSRTTDSALRAACDEIIVKFDNSYTENIVAGVLELLDEGIVDLTFDIAKEMIVGKCGIYNLFAKVGITAGNVVSDTWFNTTETKYQMQTIYCLNSISELLVPLLDNELDDLFYYDEVSEFRANYAADAIYHINLLIELRKLGEESYYKLKDSAYSSNIITACKTLGWTNLSKDEHVIDAWYSEFTSVMESVEGWLFKMIPANYYYKEEKNDVYEILNHKLVAYNGTLTSVYLPTSSPKMDYDTIAGNAFKDNETIVSVHIPYTVNEIEAYAFNNCANLKSITISELDVVIAKNAFYNCHPDLTIYGYEDSTAHNYAIANNINFVSLYSEYDDAQNFTDPDFVIEDGVLVEYLGDGGDVYIPYGVTAIGDSAFFNCTSLNNVIIPDSVVEIGSYAFQACTNLYNVIISDNITHIGGYAFYYCSNLENVIIPSNVTHIGDFAFANCKGLKEIIIPNSVINAGEAVLYGCINLRYLETPIIDWSPYLYNDCDNLYYWFGYYENRGDTGYVYEIPDNLNTIYINNTDKIPGNVLSSVRGYHYSSNMSDNYYYTVSFDDITRVILSDELQEISSYAFAECTFAESLIIPDSVHTVGSHVFFECSGLKNLTVSDNFINISEDFLKGSTISKLIVSDSSEVVLEGVVPKSVEQVVLPETIKRICDFAFSDCESLTLLSFPNALETIGEYAFYNCNALTEISIPCSVREIGLRAFAECDNLSTVKLSDNFCSDTGFINGEHIFSDTRVSHLVFLEGTERISAEMVYWEWSESLTNVHIPNSVTIIEDDVFSNCTLLTSLTIPENVTYIGGSIIYGCENLKKITYNAKNAVGSYSFQSEYVTELVIGENVENIDAYVFAGMSQLETIIWNAIDAGDCSFFKISSDETSVKKIIIGENVQRLSRPQVYVPENAFSSVTAIEYKAVNCIEWEWDDEDYLPNLNEIIIGNKVTNLPDGFLSNSVVSTVVIPENVKSLGMFGLSNSEYLKEVTILNKDFDFSYGCFEDCPNLTIYSYASNTSLVNKCAELQIPFIALCEHSNMNTSVIVEPSCTSTGIMQHFCLDCSYYFEEILPIKHNFSDEWMVDIEASCTSVGSKSRHCLICDEKTDITEIPITHRYVITTVNSTCTLDGIKTYTCDWCEDSYSEIIPASHTWSTEWTIDVDPTETTDGSKSHHCLHCDEKTDITVIPKLNAESPSTDFKYTIKNGEVTINKYIGTSSIMSIPSYIDGYPVTTIEGFAFSDNTTITKAIIPNTITNIKYYAFSDCTELLEVKLGNGISSIPQKCFSNCSKLQDIYLPETLIVIEDGAFYYCQSLTKIILPDTFNTIGEMAFYKCTSLINVNIPDTTYEIGKDAFHDTPWFKNLTGDCVIMGSGILMKFTNDYGEDVIIPEGVQSIYGTSFYETFENAHVGTVYIPSTLQNWSHADTLLFADAFVVNSKNPYVCAYEGVVYNKDRTHLLAVPSNLTGILVVPDTVIRIASNAFRSSSLTEVILNDGLLEIGEEAFYFANTKVNIPDTVITIYDSAFAYCYGITDVVIPQSVTSVGSWAFNGCSNLKSIRFLSMDCDIYDYSSTMPSTATIYGCPTSTAYFYAEEYDREFISIHNVMNGVCSVCNCSGQIVFVEDDKHIEGITAESNTVTQLQSLINLNGRYIKIYNCDGTELLDDNLVGTGSVVKIYDSATNELIVSYTIVLYGDVSGDGLIEDADYSIIALITCNTTTLENQWMLMACDVNKDGSVDGFDAIELDLYLNGYVKEISGNQTVEETVTNNTQTEALVIKNKDEEELL